MRGPCTAGNTTPLCSRTTTQPSARQRVTCLPRVHATADQGLAALAGGAAAAARMPKDERAGRVSHAVGQRQSTWTRCVRGTATRRGGALTRLGPSPSWVPAAQVAGRERSRGTRYVVRCTVRVVGRRILARFSSPQSGPVQPLSHVHAPLEHAPLSRQSSSLVHAGDDDRTKVMCSASTAVATASTLATFASGMAGGAQQLPGAGRGVRGAGCGVRGAGCGVQGVASFQKRTVSCER